MEMQNSYETTIRILYSLSDHKGPPNCINNGAY